MYVVNFGPDVFGIVAGADGASEQFFVCVYQRPYPKKTFVGMMVLLILNIFFMPFRENLSVVPDKLRVIRALSPALIL
jgi:hypothetical protein